METGTVIFLSLAALTIIGTRSSSAQPTVSCPENCTVLHQREFSHEIRNYTKVDLEIVNLAQFMQHVYSQPGGGLLERICDLNRRLNVCLSDCQDSLVKEIHVKKSSIFFLMCQNEYINNAPCLMNSTFRSSTFMDKIESACERRVSAMSTRSLWERLCLMAQCRLHCLKGPLISTCSPAAYETAKLAALAAIDEYEGTYLAQSTALVRANAKTAIVDSINATDQPTPTPWTVLRDKFDMFCDRKKLTEDTDEGTECQ